MYIYGLGENTKNLIIKLLDEIDNKKKNIKENRRLIEQYLKLVKLLNKIIPLYENERAEVLDFLKNYNDSGLKEYDCLCTKIKEINSHSLNKGIKDDSILSRFSYILSFLENGDFVDDTNAICFTDKKSNIELLNIPLVNETCAIYNDNDFLNEYRNVNNQYKYFIKLKEFINKYLSYQASLKNKKLTITERSCIKNEISFYSKEIRITKSIIKDFLDEDPSLKKKLFDMFDNNEKMIWSKLVDNAIDFYENTYLKETIDNLADTLEEKNQKSKVYCNNIKICLYQKIQNKTDLIKDDATFFEQKYILDYIDSIYPGIKMELIDSLISCDIERINYLKSVIAGTLYLEDTDYEDKITNKIKCL